MTKILIFFYSKASQRKHCNKITSLIDNNRLWQDESHHEIEGVMVDYFQKLFKHSSGRDVERVLGTLRRCVSKEMNADLLRDFTREDCMAAFKQMHPTKASRPHGIPKLFYKKYWDIM